MTTPGKYRHLNQSSTPAGHFCVLAIDHRDNLWQSLAQHAPVTDDSFTAFKQQVMTHLTASASAVLTDPEYGLGPAISTGTLGGQMGLLLPLEVTDYDLHPSRRAIRMIPDWSVEKIKRVGATGAKLLFSYHPDAPDAATKRDQVSQAVDECARWDIPLFCEPIAHSLDPERGLSNSELRQVVVESARTFSDLGIDILKTEFPLDAKQSSDEGEWRAALADLDAASKVPWALLSAGTTYDIFKRQVELACAAGASGVIVGRAVWAEAVALQGEARDQFLATTGAARMRELAEICARSGRSWRERTAAPQLEWGWHAAY